MTEEPMIAWAIAVLVKAGEICLTPEAVEALDLVGARLDAGVNYPDYSLDRLGRSSAEPKVLTYLKTRAAAAAAAFHSPKTFDGWAMITARELTKVREGITIELAASPIDGSAEEENLYHAHAVKPNGMDEHYFALHLREVFVRYGLGVKTVRKGKTSSLILEWLKEAVRRMIG